MMDREAALRLLSIRSWLSCPAKPPHGYWGSKAQHTSCLTTAQLCFPPPGPRDASLPWLKLGKALSGCCSLLSHVQSWQEMQTFCWCFSKLPKSFLDQSWNGVEKWFLDVSFHIVIISQSLSSIYNNRSASLHSACLTLATSKQSQTETSQELPEISIPVPLDPCPHPTPQSHLQPNLCLTAAAGI